MALRKRRKEAFQERTGARLGFMSFFTKAAIGALKAFPKVNAELQDNELVLKNYYDVGVAVSTDEGLVVPVMRDADHKNFAEIEGGHSGPRHQGPRGQARPRRPARRHVHHHQRRHLRLARLHPHPHHAPGGDPGDAQDPGASRWS